MKNLNDEVKPVILKDSIIPEKFIITRTKDSSIYDNKYFLVFSTTDKESGIDHYQVCEFFSCVAGESPFLLQNQTPFYFVAVNAYDMNGNFISSTLTSIWLILLIVLLLPIIGILAFIFYRKIR